MTITNEDHTRVVRVPSDRAWGSTAATHELTSA